MLGAMTADESATGVVPPPRNPADPYRICMVCLGNICRSPTAEAVMRHLVKHEGLEGSVAISSAGTGDWHVGAPRDQRSQAKIINFGILYGMGVNALRVQLGSTTADAHQFLDDYFATFKTLSEYLEKTKGFARKHGYTETLFGRRRIETGSAQELCRASTDGRSGVTTKEPSRR